MNAMLRPSAAHRDEHALIFRLSRSSHSPNSEWLAQVLASWRSGQGALPDYLGLKPQAFEALLLWFFHGVRLNGQAESGRRADFSRMLEKQDLTDFLLRHAAFPDSPETPWMADILVAGCLGEDHLWQDLGLWSRKALSELIAYNFPAIAAVNTHDMKWKKFLYKQLCVAEGIYVCRAPSCDVCIDYPNCFGSED